MDLVKKITFRQAVGHLLSWQRNEGGLAFVGKCRRGPLVGTGELHVVSDGRIEFQVLAVELDRPAHPFAAAKSVVIDSINIDAIWHSSDGHAAARSLREAITIDHADGGTLVIYRLAHDEPG
jgi:hypothetical protein